MAPIGTLESSARSAACSTAPDAKAVGRIICRRRAKGGVGSSTGRTQ